MIRYLQYFAIAAALVATISLGAKMRAQETAAAAPKASAYRSRVSRAPTMPEGYRYTPWQPSRMLDPEIAKEYKVLDTRIRDLARQYHQAESDGQRASLRKDIQDATNKQFDLKAKVRESQLAELRKQMEEVEQKIQRRADLRGQIVQRRVAELTREDDETKWDDSFAGSDSRYFRGLYDRAAFPAPAAPAAPGAGVTFSGPAMQPGTSVSTRRSTSGNTVKPSQRNTLASLFNNQVGTMSVLESQARLDIAERDFARTRSLFDSGVIDQKTMSDAEGKLSLAKIAYDEAKRQLDTRKKLLQIEIDKVKLDLEAALAKVKSIKELHVKAPRGAISESEIRNAEFEYERAELNYKQLEAMKESLQDEKEPTDETEPENRSVR